MTASRFSRGRACAWQALTVACWLSSLGASFARAEAIVLLPPGGHATLRAAQQRAFGALHDALIGQGLRVITRDEVVAEAPSEAVRDCSSIECAPSLLREVGVTLAVGVVVWPSDVDHFVYVTLVDDHGNRFPARALAQDGDVASAAKGALVDAQALLRLGPGPWLYVHGAPVGAEVMVGGKLIGRTPVRHTVASGRHVVEVRMPGHKAFVQSIDVPRNPSKQVDIEVSLQVRTAPGEDPALTAVDQADEPRMTERSAVWSFVLGGVLAAGGAAALAYGIVRATEVGDCEERDSAGRCEYEVKSSPVIPITLIAGGVALAGAVVMFAVQPIETGGDMTGAALSVGGRL